MATKIDAIIKKGNCKEGAHSLRIYLISCGIYPVPPIRGGAVESHIFNLAKQFQLNGHAVSIIDRSYDIPLLNYPFIKRLKVPSLKLKFREGILSNMINEGLFGLCTFFYLLPKRKEVDIIHAHNVIVGAACALTAFVLHKRLIYTSHNTMWTVNNVGLSTKIVQAIEKFVILRSAKTIAVCSALKTGFIKKGRIPEEKIAVIPNGVDTEYYKPCLDSFKVSRDLELGNSKVIIFVGRVMYGKGVDILIRAIPHILQKTEKPENLKFVVVGPTSQSFDPDLRSSYYDFLNRLVDELKLKRYVIFAGLLSEVDLRNLYSRSYIFVLPSRGEAEPLVLLEAMSSGLPLIGSNVGGIPEIIEEGRIGTVLNSNCSDELAVSILRLLPEQVQSVFSANSREVAVNTYDWKIISKKVINIYIDAIMS